MISVLTAVTGAGCQKKSPDSGATQATVSPAPPTPQESFAAIVETFRRGVEEVPLGFRSEDATGSQTLMTARKSVTHELLPPEKEGDPFKAKITVKTDTHYSVQRSTEKPDAKDENDSQDSDAVGSPSGGTDAQIFDPAVASTPGGSERPTKSGKAAGTVVSQENKYERTYDLVHENGRWKLITELDPNTEESIKVAFDRALASQS